MPSRFGLRFESDRPRIGSHVSGSIRIVSYQTRFVSESYRITSNSGRFGSLNRSELSLYDVD